MKKTVFAFLLSILLAVPGSLLSSPVQDSLPKGWTKAKIQPDFLLSMEEKIYYVSTVTKEDNNIGYLFLDVENAPVLEKDLYQILAQNTNLREHGKELREKASFPLSRKSFIQPTKSLLSTKALPFDKQAILTLEPLLRKFCLGGENILLYTLLPSQKLLDPVDKVVYFGTIKWSLRRSCWQLYWQSYEKLTQMLSQGGSSNLYACLSPSDIQLVNQYYQESLFFGALTLTLSDPSFEESFWKRLYQKMETELNKGSLAYSSRLSEHFFDIFSDSDTLITLTDLGYAEHLKSFDLSTNPTNKDAVAYQLLRSFVPPPSPMFRYSLRRTGKLDTAGPRTLSLLWKKSLGDWVVSSPVVLTDQSILIGCFDGNLYHLSSTGEILWKFYAGSWIVSTPAVSQDGTIYFGNQNGTLFAVNKEGKLNWKVALGSMIGSSPAITPLEEIICGSFDGSMICVRKDGTIKWKFPTGSWVLSSPAVMDNGNIVFGSTDHYVYCLSPSGALLWKYKTGNMVVASPAVDDLGRIYIGSLDQTFYCLAPDGTLSWKYPAKSWVISSASVGESQVYFAEKNGTIHALDLKGKQSWSYQTSGVLEGSPLLDKNEVLYITSWDRKLYAIDQGQLLWSFTFESESRSTPTLSKEGTLYVGAEDSTIYAFSK